MSGRVLHKVTVRFQPAIGSHPREVVVVGEPTDWRNGLALEPRADGSFAGELDLPTGIYAYKLLVDGRHVVDPSAVRRVTTREGHENGLIVLGGTDEPFVLAPAPPHVVPTRHGLRLFVGVRMGALGASREVRALVSREAEDAESVVLEHAFDHGDLAYFHAVLRGAASRVRLEVRSEDHLSTRVLVSHGRARGTKSLADHVLCTVFVDRFRGRDVDLEPSYHSTSRPLGGHLDGITRSLDELTELGIDTLVLTPVHVAESAHRYDFVDPLAVCEDIGGEASLVRLLDEAHARGMKVFADVSFSHAGAEFPPAKDVLALGRASPHADMFLFSKEGTLLHYGTRERAPLVDQRHPEVVALAEATARWLGRLGFDGLRLDMVAELPEETATVLREAFLAERPSGIVYGEVVPQHAWRYASFLDASTDFSYFEAARATFATDQASLGDLVRAVIEGDLLRGVDESTSTVRFLSTHDHARFASVAVDAPGDRFALAWLFTVFLPGAPMLLYGEEIGLAAREAARAAEDVWPDRMPMVFDRRLRDEALRAVVRDITALRRDHPALRSGPIEWLHVGDDLVVARRRLEGDVVFLVMSTSHEPREVEVDDPTRPEPTFVLGIGGAALRGKVVELPGRSAAILSGGKPPEGRTTAEVLRNLALVSEDMAHGRAEPLSRPTRIDFAVTEACNLACVHCITDAPRRTRERTFRELSQATIDALAEDLSYATYFGFVHGGESLTSPMTTRVLEAIREAKAGLPYTAHLLTNGMLLDGKRATGLASLGVNSVSISLDGHDALTNDAIRVGARFETIVGNVREVVEARRGVGLDLRIGLSVVVMAENVTRLPSLVELAARLGVDWVKLEELVPVSSRARRSLLAPADTARYVDEARAVGARLGLTVVDHTDPSPVFPCTATDAQASFLRDDAFANRFEDFHPCRAAWEIACVEPDGQVRLGDFFGPVLGRVGPTSIASLWSSPVAREHRERVVAVRPCGRGPRACERHAI
ncbi:MAG: alpha-amylase family glycosyl hydrolase [Polyangiaceae bacterium]